MTEPEPTLALGPGTYNDRDRTYTVKVGRQVYTYVRPDHEPLDQKGREVLGPSSFFVQVACRLFAKSGEWPSWFRWAVGWPIPRRFALLGSRMALEEVQRRQAETEPVAHWPRATVSAKQKSVGPEVRVGSRLVVLPSHVCRGVIAMDACGPVDADMRGKCTTRRAWRIEKKGNERVFVPVDSPGCGATFVLNHYGIRVRE